jgi:hypothetical protein
VTHLAVLGSLSQVVDEVRAHETVYLRYSEGPEEDLIRRSSRDYEADVELPGLSVTVASPEPWWPGPAEDWWHGGCASTRSWGRPAGGLPGCSQVGS